MILGGDVQKAPNVLFLMLKGIKTGRQPDVIGGGLVPPFSPKLCWGVDIIVETIQDMCSIKNRKIFGVALDASDDPLTLQLKGASIRAQERGIEGLCTNPYEALMKQWPEVEGSIEPVGNVPVPSWLTPLPRPSDRHLITKETMEAFVAEGGVREISEKVKHFVLEKVLPGFPLMIGVDHSATGGAISALSSESNPEQLSVLVLDQHFDGLPLALRLEAGMMETSGYPEGRTRAIPGILEDEAYCCGNFWKHLMDEGIVLPENLFFVGVADYPGEEMPPEWDKFRQNYLKFERRGCRFFSLKEFRGNYLDKLRRFIKKGIAAPNLYVSLDLDVGAYQCVHAARYMDWIGIDREALTAVVQIINELREVEKVRMVGLDVMEFNMHFLGLEIEPGKRDRTLEVARDFINALLFFPSMV